MIVEDLSRDIEQLTDERVSQRVSHRQSFLLRRHDVLVAEHGQLLRDGRLIERQRFLQFLHRASPADEPLQQADPGRVGQRAKELGLERRELAGGRRARFPGSPRGHWNVTIF